MPFQKYQGPPIVVSNVPFCQRKINLKTVILHFLTIISIILVRYSVMKTTLKGDF